MRYKPRVLAVIGAIPEGRVTTYGTIARHLRLTARQVAFFLARLTDEESAALPWFRVVAANGVVSTTKLGQVGRRQIERLRAEGVSVTPRNKIAGFASVHWSPPGQRASRVSGGRSSTIKTSPRSRGRLA